VNGDHGIESHKGSEQEVTYGHDGSSPIADEKSIEERLASGAVDWGKVVWNSRNGNVFTPTLPEVKEVAGGRVVEGEEGPGDTGEEDAVESGAEGSAREIPNDGDHGLPEAHQEGNHNEGASNVGESLGQAVEGASHTTLEPESGLKRMLETEEGKEENVVEKRVNLPKGPACELIDRIGEELGKSRGLHAQVSREEDGLKKKI